MPRNDDPPTHSSSDMENLPKKKTQSQQSNSFDSVTSAIDLPGPLAPSPSLQVSIEPDHSRQRSLARRRSWGSDRLREVARAESSSGHPPHLHLDSNMSSQGGGGGGGGNDPFLSNRQHPILPYTDNVYSGSTSRASLMRGHFEHEIEDDNHPEDDQAHLTSNMSRTGTDTLLLEDDNSSPSPNTQYSVNDPEIEGGSTPRTRRRTVRYSVTPSPLKKTETAIKSVSKNLRRISLRVVNLANTGLEGQLRLGNGNEDGDEKRLALEDDEDDDGPPQPDLKKVFPIRGRALGFLGPESKIRLALFNFLVHPCVFYSIPPQLLD